MKRLEVSHLTVTTGDIPLVTDSSFTLREGQVLGLVGESGSGKTITSLALLGLLPEKVQMTAGSIQLNGQEISHNSKEQWRKLRGEAMAIIIQNPMTAFNPVRTIEKHFIETLRAHKKLTKAEAYAIALQHLEKVELRNPMEIMKQFPFQLSGGMLQRVMIAITLALQPSVIIADEPTTALDATNQLQVLKQLKLLQQKTNVAMLLISHNLGVISYLAQDVIVMYNGYIVERAPKAELFTNPQHPYTKLLIATRKGLSDGTAAKLPPHDVTRPPKTTEVTCPYIARCPLADASCKQQIEIVAITAQHEVRCQKVEVV